MTTDTNNDVKDGGVLSDDDIVLHAADIVWVPLAQMEVDGEQYRRSYAADKLRELANSIERYGVRQNLEVFKTDQLCFDGPVYRVCIGNRRFRAVDMIVGRLGVEMKALEVGSVEYDALKVKSDRLSLVPCRVLSADEVGQAKYLQIIENLQREDVSAADEARGFAWLVDHHGDSPKSISVTLGVTERFVYNRLKLVQAPKRLLNALDKGVVGTRICEIVGRLPTDEDRRRITGSILDPKHRDGVLTIEEVESLIERDYMVALKMAVFDRELENIIPGVGACVGCPLRTGNMVGVELASHGGGKSGVDPNRCTSPKCFREKTDAAWAMVERQAEDGNQLVLPHDEARRVFAGAGGKIAFDSELVELSDRPTAKDTGHHNNKKTWNAIVKELGDVPVILARHPSSGKTMRLVKRAVVIEAVNAGARAKGKPSMFDKQTASDEGRKVAHQAAREVKADGLKLAILALDGLGDKLAEKMSPELVRAFLAVHLDESPDAEFLMGKWLQIAKPKDADLTQVDMIMEFIDSGDRTIDQLLAYLGAAIIAPSLRDEGLESPHYLAFVKALNIKVPSLKEGGEV